VIGWVDASAGAAGNMLLGALLDAGVPLAVVQEAVDRIAPEPVHLGVTEVHRAGLRALRCEVGLADSTGHRTWRDVRRLLDEAGLAAGVHARAHRVFLLLAQAEGEVHGTDPDEVHFHEVGALDAMADVVGVCAALDYLGIDTLTVSTVGVGSGSVTGAHGILPVPPPAVAALLRGAPSQAGQGTTETCTPTGAALLVALADGFGPQPAMTVGTVGVGAGGRDPQSHANVVRVLLGEPLASSAPNDPVLLETNVDDLDPRLWPDVLAALLAAGAHDAWLTPILMKKGRPAHMLSVLAPATGVDAARALVFTHTTTIGLRERSVSRSVCDREVRTVEVDGRAVRVKVASWSGRVVNAQTEYDDVLAAAAALGRPPVEVLAAAAALARTLVADAYRHETT